MTLAQWIAVAAGTGVVSLVVWRRHRLLDVSCMGAFFLSHVVMVILGLLAAPWLVATHFPASFPYISWEWITEADLIRATVIVVGGVGLVVLGDRLADLATSAVGAPPRLRWGGLLGLPPVARDGVTLVRVVITFLLLATLATGLFMTRWADFRAGVTTGYLAQEFSAQFAAREAIQELGRPFYLLVFNALPFCAALLWMLARRRDQLMATLISALAVGIGGFFLFATFEKRPLALFAITMFLAHATVSLDRGWWGVRRAGAWFTRIPSGWLFLVILVPTVLLLGLYYVSTNLASEIGLSTELLRSLLAVVGLRLVGRLSIMPILYSHFYPELHPHYGVANIGALSALTDTPVYRDTIDVWVYFTNYETGTGAIGSLMDTWAAFGWAGWAVGALLIGVGLNALDRWLASLPATVLNRCFYLFMIVFASTLSQASLPRALSTYGGLAFLSLWIWFRIRFVSRAPVGQVLQPGAP